MLFNLRSRNLHLMMNASLQEKGAEKQSPRSSLSSSFGSPRSSVLSESIDGLKKTTIASQQHIISSLSAKNAELLEQDSARQEEIKELRSQVGKLQTALTSHTTYHTNRIFAFEEKVNSLKAEVCELKRHKAALEDQMVRLQQTQEQHRDQIAEHEQKLGECDKSVAEQIDGLAAAYEKHLSTTCAEYDAQIELLNNKIKDGEGQLGSLKTKLKELQLQCAAARVVDHREQNGDASSLCLTRGFGALGRGGVKIRMFVVGFLVAFCIQYLALRMFGGGNKSVVLMEGQAGHWLEHESACQFDRRMSTNAGEFPFGHLNFENKTPDATKTFRDCLETELYTKLQTQETVGENNVGPSRANPYDDIISRVRVQVDHVFDNDTSSWSGDIMGASIFLFSALSFGTKHRA